MQLMIILISITFLVFLYIIKCIKTLKKIFYNTIKQFLQTVLFIMIVLIEILVSVSLSRFFFLQMSKYVRPQFIFFIIFLSRFEFSFTKKSLRQKK